MYISLSFTVYDFYIIFFINKFFFWPYGIPPFSEFNNTGLIFYIYIYIPSKNNIVKNSSQNFP